MLKNLAHALSLRTRRKRYLYRALRKGRELTPVVDRTHDIAPRDILLFCTARNEKIRLPYFLKYYRSLGVRHFLFVDNDSKDGSIEYLRAEEDCSIWHTTASYRDSRFGVDWMNALLRRHGCGHWCVVVDPDEFLVYPFVDTRPLRALTDWLDDTNLKSFGTMLLDMYPKGSITARPYAEGQNPFEIARWFDPGNYSISRNWDMDNLWIQGGPRARSMFANTPKAAPSLNKIPLIKWQRNFAYVSSTHAALPRGLNRVYEDKGGERTTGVLLHAKFLHVFTEKAREELERGQHYAASHEYRAYAQALENEPDLWCRHSEAYINWRQLDVFGLLSKGNWT